MIKESEIYNFVSLIKALKKQRISNHQNIGSSIFNNITYLYRKSIKDQAKRIGSKKIKSKEQEHKSQQCVEENFSELKMEARPQTLKRKKIYQVYCQQKKKKLAHSKTSSIHKSIQLGCDGTSFIRHKNGKSHKMYSIEGKELKRNHLEYQQKTQIFRNTTRSRQTLKNTAQRKFRFIQTKKSNQLKYFSSPNLLQNKYKGQTLYFKNPKSKTKQLLNSYQSQINSPSNDVWTLEAWEHPAESVDDYLTIKNY